VKNLENSLGRPLALAGTAFVVRLVYVLLFPGGEYFEGISSSYVHVIDNMLSGHGITTYVDVAPLSSPERSFVYEPFVDRPLGYLFLIFLPYAFSGSILAVQILHASLAAASVLLLRFIGGEWFGARIGTRAAWLYAVWPLAARFEVTVLPDAVMPFFLLAVLALLQKAVRGPSQILLAGAAGTVLGVGLTMRPDILLLPLFLLIGFWLPKRAIPSFGALGAFAAGLLIMLGVHTIRNYQVTGGKIAPLGLGNGISMWEGISQFGDTLGTLYGDTRLAQKEGYPTWAYPNGVERDRARFAEAVEILSENPGFSAVLVLRRIPVIVTVDGIMTTSYAQSLGEYLREDRGRTVVSYAIDHPLALAVRAVTAALHLVTILLAFVALRWHRALPAVWIPFLVIFYYIAIHLPTNTEARYLYPVIPLLLLLTSVAWTHIHELIPRAGAREHHDPGL